MLLFLLFITFSLDFGSISAPICPVFNNDLIALGSMGGKGRCDRNVGRGDISDFLGSV